MFESVSSVLNIVLIIVIVLIAAGAAFIINRFRNEAKTAKEELEKEKERADALEKSKDELEEARSAAKRVMDARADFLARMSHDMRTPMNSILGMSIIGKIHLSEKDKVADCLRKIHYAGMHLSTLINDVHVLTKMEAGSMELEEKPFDFRELIHNIDNIIRDKAEDKNQHFEIDSENVFCENVIGDMSLLQQVFIHILENAVRYTPEGGNIRFVVNEMLGEDDDKDNFEFIISDNGIGISPEFQEHMFEAFSREAKGDDEENHGSGLGLAIVYSILQMMNGEVDIESEPGNGTTFRIKIGLRVEQRGGEAGEEDEIDAETKTITSMNFAGKRVLLAEDNAFNADVAIELLSATGVTVDHVWNGQAAFDAVLDNAPFYYDLVFMDIQMPVMNGHDAAQIIRAAGRTDMEQLPIVAISANAFAEDVSASFEAGMNGHIAKPLNMNSLESTLRQYLTD